MKLRQLVEADIDALLGLWNRNMPHDQVTPELLEEKVWDDPGFEADMAFWVEHHHFPIGFVMGVVRQEAEGPVGFIKLLVVDEKYQRGGIGSRLVHEVEQHLKARKCLRARVFESAPNYLMPGIDARYTRALVFFEKQGYKRIGETWNMEVDLNKRDFVTRDEEKALAERGIEIRRAIMGDNDELTNFLRQNWPAWVDEVQRSLLNYPISCHLALLDGKIIAFSAYDCNNFNTGWFGPMGTLTEHRSSGIGGVLLRRCLADIKQQGHRYATIPWVGPIAFYLHYAGAEIARVFYRYEKVLVHERGTSV